MQNLFKQIAKRVFQGMGINYKALTIIPDRLDTVSNQILSLARAEQINLWIKYKDLSTRNIILPFEEVELRVNSQNGEDGILLYIFSVIGFTNRKCVEMCAGDGMECNTANLIIQHS